MTRLDRKTYKKLQQMKLDSNFASVSDAITSLVDGDSRTDSLVDAKLIQSAKDAYTAHANNYTSDTSTGWIASLSDIECSQSTNEEDFVEEDRISELISSIRKVVEDNSRRTSNKHYMELYKSRQDRVFVLLDIIGELKNRSLK